jgi:hypothetical protein
MRAEVVRDGRWDDGCMVVLVRGVTALDEHSGLRVRDIIELDIPWRGVIGGVKNLPRALVPT